MELNFNLSVWSGVFAVPSAIVDDYIKIATGDNLKVLLYSLRHSGQTLSAGEISRATGIPPDNVTTSLEFWNKLISEAPAAIATPATVSSAPSPKSKSDLLDRDYDFSPKEIADTIRGSNDVAYLFKRCEALYGRPLKHNEQKALQVITEDVGMSPGVTLMLLEFCFSLGKTNPAYIKKVAKDWCSEEIDTITKAEEKIKQINDNSAANATREKEVFLKPQKAPKARVSEKPSFDLNELDKQIMEEYINS